MLEAKPLIGNGWGFLFLSNAGQKERQYRGDTAFRRLKQNVGFTQHRLCGANIVAHSPQLQMILTKSDI